jgi:outer membrane protein assembly factor BamB
MSQDHGRAWARTTAVLGLCLGLGLAFGVGATHAASGDRCQFRNGPDHLGVQPGPAPGDIGGQAWKVPLGGPIIASPTLCDGVIYVGAKDGGFNALDPASGKIRWRFVADAPVTASAAVAGGLAYFQSDAGTIYALRTGDGTLAWTRKTGPDLPFMNYRPGVDFWDYWASSPLYADGAIYVGGGDGVVRALDARTGAVIWTYATRGRVRATPATDGRRIFVGGFDGAMYALDRADGKLAWSFQTQGNSDFKIGSIQSSAAVTDGLVLFGSRDYRLYALDAATGKPAWIAPHKSEREDRLDHRHPGRHAGRVGGEGAAVGHVDGAHQLRGQPHALGRDDVPFDARRPPPRSRGIRRTPASRGRRPSACGG